MDPLTIIGLTSNILSFIDFSWKLFEGGVELYRNGSTHENARLSDIISDLSSLSDNLKRKSSGTTDSEKKIKQLAADCYDDSQILLETLQKLGPGQRRKAWGTLKSLWNSIKKKEEIEELRERLGEYRAEIMLHLQQILIENQSGIGASIATIESDCKSLHTKFSAEIQKLRDDLTTVISEAVDRMENPDMESSPNFQEKLLLDISQKLEKLDHLCTQIPVQHRILRQLLPRNEDFSSRHRQIHSAAKETCGWILGDDRSKLPKNGSSDIYQSPAKNILDNVDDTQKEINLLNQRYRAEMSETFLLWLRTGEGVFHISGNPGSGKSTLMKYIARADSTRRELEVWSHPKTIVVAEFYFWKSGTVFQRAISGLYKSLLFQVLSSCPELIEDVFPHQWKQFSSLYGDRKVEATLMSDDVVEVAFNQLMTKAVHLQHKFCFFIDGLDECEGNELDHENLAKKLNGWTKIRDVKICASSRPHQELIENIANSSSLTLELHRLNQSDIRRYCFDRFRNDDKTGSNWRIYEQLLNEVVKNACGVFLWAHLVIEILLVGVRRPDTLDILHQKLREIPPELGKVYTELRNATLTSKVDRIRSNRLLFLATNNPFQDMALSSVAFSWLEDSDGLKNANFPLDLSSCKPYSEEEIMRRQAQIRGLVNTLARGILQVNFVRGWEMNTDYIIRGSMGCQTVGFVHRTARDYLLEEKTRLDELRESVADLQLDIDTIYARIHLAEYAFGRQIPKNIDDDETIFLLALKDWFRRLKFLSMSAATDVFDKMDRATEESGRHGSLTQRFCPLIRRFYTLSFSFSMKYRMDITYYVEPIPGSLWHFVISIGQGELMLAKLRKGNYLENTMEDNLDMFLSALLSFRYDFALQLLDNKYCSLNDNCIIRGPDQTRSAVPVWVLALLMVIPICFEHIVQLREPFDWDDMSFPDPFRRIFQHVNSDGMTFKFSLVFDAIGTSNNNSVRKEFLEINNIELKQVYKLYHESISGACEDVNMPIETLTLDKLFTIMNTRREFNKSKLVYSQVCWNDQSITLGKDHMLRIY